MHMATSVHRADAHPRASCANRGPLACRALGNAPARMPQSAIRLASLPPAARATARTIAMVALVYDFAHGTGLFKPVARSPVVCAATFGRARAEQTGGQRVVRMEGPRAHLAPAAGGAAPTCPSSQEQPLAHPAPAAASASTAHPATQEPPLAHSVPAAAGAATGPPPQQQPLTPMVPVATGTATTSCPMPGQPVAPSAPADAAGAASTGHAGQQQPLTPAAPVVAGAASTLRGMQERPVAPPAPATAADAATAGRATQQQPLARTARVIAGAATTERAMQPVALSAPAPAAGAAIADPGDKAAASSRCGMHVQAAAGGRRARRSACPDRKAAAPCSPVAAYAGKAAGGAEQLDPELLDEFEQLVQRTGDANVQKVLRRNKTKLVSNGAVSESALQGLTKEELAQQPFKLLAGDAAALKVAFPSPASGGAPSAAAPAGGSTTSPQELARAMAPFIKQAVAQQQQQARLEEQKSLTDYTSQLDSEVGDKMLANAEEERDAQEFLGPLAPEPVTPAMRALVKQIVASTEEEEVQVPMVQLMQEIARAGLHIVDAHKVGQGYILPDGRQSAIDAVLSLVPETQWGAVVSLAELKYLFKTKKKNEHKQAVGQVMKRWQHLLLFQQNRQFLLALIMDKQELQLWKLHADGTMERSKRYQVFYTPDDEGWQVLVAFVRASADRLGYQAALAPAPFKTTAGQLSAILLVADHGRRQVFNSKLTSGSGSSSTVVLKVASEEAIKAEVVPLQAVQQLGKAVFPQYLAHGTLPSPLSSSLTHYVVTSPYGQHLLTADLTRTKLTKYIGDTVTAVELLEQQGWLHRDIKPTNLILDPVSGQVILNDYHLATRLPARYEDVSGARVTRALRVHRTRQHTIASDLESIFLTYLYLSSSGKALRWRNQPMRYTAAIKHQAMFDTAEWGKALSRCKAELQPVLSRLYGKVYRQGDFALYMEQPVTIEEFKEALKG